MVVVSKTGAVFWLPKLVVCLFPLIRQVADSASLDKCSFLLGDLADSCCTEEFLRGWEYFPQSE